MKRNTLIIISLIIFGFFIYKNFLKPNVNEDTEDNHVNQVNEVSKNETMMDEQKELSEEELDLIQHNKNVMTQINNYIQLSDTKNYSHDNIAMGTLKLLDHHDIY